MRRPMRKFQCVLRVTVFIAVSICTAFAGNRSGSVTGQFLKLPINARSVGMGNAQVALAEGAQSIAYNPAGILSIPDKTTNGRFLLPFARSQLFAKHDYFL